ncbi:MAG: hypothetical protein ACODAA_03715 [Gemmatimonadota bacterium]
MRVQYFRGGSWRGTAVFGLLVSGLLLSACDGDPDDGGPTGAGGDLPTLAVSPASASPGAVLHLSGMDPATVQGEVTLTIGGDPAAILPNEAGGWVASVPLFQDEEGQPDPPTTAVDVVLLVDGEPTAAARGGLMVTSLEPAPGSAGQLIDRLTEAGDALVALAAAEADAVNSEGQYRYAVSMAFREIVAGDDPLSMRSQLDSIAADPASLALLDAVVASSSLLAASDRMTEQLQNLATDGMAVRWGAEAMSAEHAPNSITGASLVAAPPTELTEYELVYKMQQYELRKLFGEEVIGNTATTWGNIFSLGGGAFELVEKVQDSEVLKPFKKVGLALSLIDFYINKISLGLLPATVDDLSLELASTSLTVGGITDAEVVVVASNEPPSIGVQDIVGQILGVLGGLGPAGTPVQELANYVLGTIQSFIAQYASQNPDANLNAEVATVPEFTWQATIEDTRFLERHTSDPAVLDGEITAIEWKAYAPGQADIWTRSATGILVIDPGPGVDFNTGVFGDQINLETNRVTVEVTEALSFAGSYVGTYSASGGCNEESQSGNIEFQITQDGTTLTVTYSLDPDFDGLTVYGGQAEIIAETPRSFVGTITEPSQLQGTFDGALSEDGTEISGIVQGTAQALCNGVPTGAGFSGSYEGTRQ